MATVNFPPHVSMCPGHHCLSSLYGSRCGCLCVISLTLLICGCVLMTISVFPGRAAFPAGGVRPAARRGAPVFQMQDHLLPVCPHLSLQSRPAGVSAPCPRPLLLHLQRTHTQVSQSTAKLVLNGHIMLIYIMSPSLCTSHVLQKRTAQMQIYRSHAQMYLKNNNYFLN